MGRDEPHQSYKIQQFDPTSIKNDAIWIIIGPRNTGKTVLLRDILYKNRHKCDFVMAMTETESSAEIMRTYMPKRLVYNRGYNAQAAEAFLNMSKELAAKKKIRHAWIVEDDLMSDSKFLLSRTQTDMHLNGRHYHESIFCTSQFPTCHPPKLRANADVVIALRCNSHADRKRLYDFYFSSSTFGSLAEFERVFEACTANYGALVIDKTSPDASIAGCIRHYTADPRPRDFRLGRPIFFELSDLVDRADQAKQQRNERSTTKVVP